MYVPKIVRNWSLGKRSFYNETYYEPCFFVLKDVSFFFLVAPSIAYWTPAFVVRGLQSAVDWLVAHAPYTNQAQSERRQSFKNQFDTDRLGRWFG